MPEFEVVDGNEAALKVPDNKTFVPAAFRVGRFEVLTPLQRNVLMLRYLGEEPLTDEEVGRLLEPPKSAGSVARVRLQAIRRLDYYHICSIDSLGLSIRTRNAILREFGNISPEELALRIEDDQEGLLHSTRNFGEKSLKELKEKLVAY